MTELRQKYDRVGASPPAQLLDGLTCLAGLYLAISPWVVGFAGFRNLLVNNLIVGLAVAALSIGFASAFGRTYGVSWATPLLGIWTIIAPWVISGQPATTATIWNNVVTGALILIFGAGALGMALSGRGRHGQGVRHGPGEW
ncbi:SPW repeat protein [Microbispora sp. RL4-1S]|uniref:SPW repeat protein n=1 Tax=Microbispora oryzae TaxID=2806554 RepID=A0A940WSM0_9ACTN|nr:SPW repeat protein [Microbispora oryzae]MBP2708663.1 SPW repeat protein [Microbispora oryzae]